MTQPRAYLAGEVIALAMCWKLTRTDGVVLGFTSHDASIEVDGVRYVARPGMTPSAVRQSGQLRADSMEIEGVLDAAAVTGFDLDCGRWRGARIELLAVDWRSPGGNVERLLTGYLGEVSRPVAEAGPERGGFGAELHTEFKRLEDAGAVRLSPTCRADLGDARCGVDLDGRRAVAGVTDVAGERVGLLDPLADFARYTNGMLRFLDGPLCGLDSRIAVAEAQALLLEDAVGWDGPLAGRVRLTEGCDKRLATCRGRFANARAFDGEPHLPGTDALLRYAVP